MGGACPALDGEALPGQFGGGDEELLDLLARVFGQLTSFRKLLEWQMPMRRHDDAVVDLRSVLAFALDDFHHPKHAAWKQYARIGARPVQRHRIERVPVFA